MAETRIEWTATRLPDGTMQPGYTFNPWIGCTKVSPACANCYAESWAKRTGQAQLWQGERRRTSAANWQQPRKWNRDAETAGVRRRVFCASLADVFDNQVSEEWRHDLWSLIDAAWHLDWLLLTKRPQNIAKMLPVMDSRQPGYRPWKLKWPWPHVWLGTTVENQEEADRRIPDLLATPAAVRFLSCEPLLGPVDLTHLRRYNPRGQPWIDALRGLVTRGDYLARSPSESSLNTSCRVIPPELPRIDWVIVGSESGPRARPCALAWVRSLRDQCTAADVAFFWKQHVVGGRKISTPELDGRRWIEFPRRGAT